MKNILHILPIPFILPILLILSILIILLPLTINAGTVEKIYRFEKYSIRNSGPWQKFSVENTKLYGIPGEPLLPWQEVALMLPPGEAAVAVEIIREQELVIAERINLVPAGYTHPVGEAVSSEPAVNRDIYQTDGPYPLNPGGKLNCQYLNGFGFALTTFTPLSYNPLNQWVSLYGKVTVRVHTEKSRDAEQAAENYSGSERTLNLARNLSQNPQMANAYPARKSALTGYNYLIISPAAFKNEFQPLITLYSNLGITARVVTTDSIKLVTSGFDTPEKIRNFIINQYQNYQVQYVLLAGNPALVPCRYLHDTVYSSSLYRDSIPADLYYAGLDGTYDANGNHKYGETVDNADLLPELSVGRFPVNDTSELRKMIRKTVAYQANPVRGEFSKPLLAGEYLYASPLTFGSDYMNLLIDNHTDHGYFTHGIPSASNQVGKLYDTIISTPPLRVFQWSTAQLLARLNQGNSFIHHLGHANASSMLRLTTSNIINSNFQQIDGVVHNFQLLYTQGCDDGAFDQACIASKAVKIDNWLVAGIFNSRYGWFDEGTSEGPSQHLEREFVSAVYNDTTTEKHIGTAHTISKIKTAPWVSLPGEFEPGAQRWCQFGCNLLGDPALKIWTAEPDTFIEATWTGAVDSDWQKAGNWSSGMVPGSVFNVTIPATLHNPVISSTGNNFCNNLTIGSSANLTIAPGKSLLVYGHVTMTGDK